MTDRVRVVCLAFALWLSPLWLAQDPAAAQDQAAAEGDAQHKTASEGRATTFEAVTGPVKEDVPGGPLLLAAYALVWLAVFGYVFRLVRLQRGVVDNLSRLERDFAKATQRADAPK